MATLGDVLHISFVTQNDKTRVAVDADSTPTVTIYKDSALTPMTLDSGSITVNNTTSVAGLYTAEIDTGIDDDFVAGSDYNVFAMSTVDGVTGGPVCIGTFSLTAPDGVDLADVLDAIAAADAHAAGAETQATSAASSASTAASQATTAASEAAAAHARADLLATQTSVDGIASKTTNLPASPAAVGSAMTLTTGERTSIATAVVADASIKKALQALTGKTISDTSDNTIKVYDTNGTDLLYTLTVVTAGTTRTATPS